MPPNRKSFNFIEVQMRIMNNSLDLLAIMDTFSGGFSAHRLDPYLAGPTSLSRRRTIGSEERLIRLERRFVSRNFLKNRIKLKLLQIIDF